MALAGCWIGTALLGLGMVTAPRGVRLLKDRVGPYTGCEVCPWPTPYAGGGEHTYG
jgi:hypothetical protein